MKQKAAHAVMCVLVMVATALTLVHSAQAGNKYRVLHHFLNKPASAPSSALVADAAGNLYGVTRDTNQSKADNCGQYACGGAVFKLTRGSGGTWSYSVIHVFQGPDGSLPQGSLIFDSSGNLYGTTADGGAHNYGAVFELSPSGGKWTETVLYSFAGYPADLDTPTSALTFDASGNLYGTATNAATNAQGGVFELKPSSNGWQETVLHSFTGGSDGSNPYTSSVVLDPTGNVYGTTLYGGEYGFGVVFELTNYGGSWTETVIHAFEDGVDGADPASGVIFDTAGNLYGTTPAGGVFGEGTVFDLAPSMGNWTLGVVHSFNHSQYRDDGYSPFAPLVFDSAGNLYGATEKGGYYDNGIVFKLSQSGGMWYRTTLHSFHELDGLDPFAGLIVDQQGVLYSTAGGGAEGYGVVFSITP